MRKYLVRRSMQSLLVVAIAMVGIFFIGRVLGDPVDAMVTPLASEDVRERVREELGLNDPLVVQFARFLGRVATLDFGISPVTSTDALQTVLSALPHTLYLAAGIIVLAFPLGLLMGAVGAYRPGSIIDRVTNVVALTGISVVEFWLGIILILLIAVPLAGIPTGGSGGLSALLLPAITGAFRIIGRVAQFSRATLLEEFGKPYVEMARAKGVSDRRLFVHVAKNASIAIVTLSADEFVGLLNGVVVIETVFAWPGLGRLIVRALERRDLFVLEAAVFMLVLIVIVANLLIDLSYAMLNPKVRYE